MVNLIKIIILLFAFANIFTFANNGNAQCVICCIIMVVYIIYDLRQSYIRFVYGECTDIHSRSKYKNNDSEWDGWDEWFGDFNNSLYVPNKTYQKTESNRESIKKIEKNMHLSDNFLEFCGNKKYLVNPQEITIDDKSKEKPQVDMVSVIKEIEQNSVSDKNNNLNGEDVIFIINNNTVDDAKKKIYNCILKIINKESLKPNKRYALLQSFNYIDICPASIVIYIDNFILQKAELSEKDLCKEEIICSLKKELCFQKLDVQFVEYKNVSLLNYYLKQ